MRKVILSKSGQTISLGPAESISVLNPSGDLVTITESSVFEQADLADRRELSAWDAATWNERRTAIGGTRTQTYEECVALAETRADLTDEDCAEIHLASQDDAPTLNLRLLGNPQAISIGQPIKLSLNANFEADVSCSLRSSGSEDLPLAARKN